MDPMGNTIHLLDGFTKTRIRCCEKNSRSLWFLGKKFLDGLSGCFISRLCSHTISNDPHVC